MVPFSGRFPEWYTGVFARPRFDRSLTQDPGIPWEGRTIAGHSKWANIKHTKAKQDAQRGAVFTKMSREIIVAAKTGGGDPAGNFRLRQAIDKARASGVPNDNIKRAIAKGAGADGADQLEELQYEGYGPGGAGIIVRALTDNRNRTAADLRAAFSKAVGNLGETGCVGWMFAEKGQILISNPDGRLTEDEVLAVALEAGAQDLVDHGDAWEVLTEPADFEAVFGALSQTGWPIESSELSDVPSTMQVIDDPDVARKLVKLMGKLEDLDDVQRVSSNFEIPDALMAELTAIA
jgi:YebC/PmpR family DNA-binding regulatory protein